MPSWASGRPRLRSRESAALYVGCTTCMAVGTGARRVVFGGSGYGIPVSSHALGEGPSRCPQNAQNTQAAGATSAQVWPNIPSIKPVS